VKGTTATFFAFHADFTAHHFYHPRHYGQPQARATKATSRTTVGLPERLEYVVQPVLGNADPSVRHLESQFYLII